jgi:hypothetical protein
MDQSTLQMIQRVLAEHNANNKVSDLQGQSSGGNWVTNRGVNRAGAAGAGNGAGQTHVDDWVAQNRDFNDYGKASLLTPGTEYFNNWVNPDDGSMQGDTSIQDRAQAALKQAQQYDPNAHFGEDGRLTFDRSKLPEWKAPEQYKSSTWSPLSANDAGGRVLDNKYVLNGGEYGQFTPNFNLKQAGNDSAGGGVFGMTEKYMPSIISAILAAGIGAGAGPMLGGLISSTAGPGGVAEKLLGGQKVDWGNLAKNAGMSVAGGLLAGGGGLGNLGSIGQSIQDMAPWINRAKQAYSLYQMYNKGRG